MPVPVQRTESGKVCNCNITRNINISFYVHVTVLHRNTFLYNKTNQMHKIPKFTPAWNSTCFGQFFCPSSGVYSLYTRHWYMTYSFLDSFRAVPSWSCSNAVYKPVWYIPVPSVQWINPWWWQGNCPKHVEFHAGVNLGNLCIWLVLL